jgi:hypothetical protein
MSAPVMDQPKAVLTRTHTAPAPNSIAPFIAAMLVIVLGAVALVYFRGHQKLGMPGVKVVNVPLRDDKGKAMTKQSVPLPENVPGFESKPVPIDENQLRALPRDTTYGRRFYYTEDGFRAVAGVVLMGSDRTSIHKPEFCLPGGGWHIQKKEADEIAIAGPQPYKLPVMKWTVRQETRGGTVAGLYVFWFVDDHEMTREHSGRMISIAKGMFTKGELERWSYISFLVACAPGQEDSAYEKVKTLIAATVPQFQLVNGASVSK